MASPRKTPPAPSRKKTTRFTISMPEPVHAAGAARARQLVRSLSNYIAFLIERDTREVAK